MAGTGFGFCGEDFTLENPNSGIQRTVNLIPELVNEPNQKPRILLNDAPGLLAFTTAGIGPFRGAILWNGLVYAVSRDKVYSITAAGVATLLGTISNLNHNAPVSMAASVTQLGIFADGLGYYIQAGVLAQITDIDFPAGVLKGDYSDGYHIVVTMRYVFISALNDITSWDALDFTVVQASVNDLVSLLIMNRQLVVFGTMMAQIFNNTGNADFPYEADASGIIDFGAAAIFGAARCGNTFLFLQADERGSGTVINAAGQKVTNHGQDYAFQGYATISDAIAFSFQYRGHNFFQISFPTAGVTHRFDLDENFWHEALYWNTGTGAFEAHLGQFHVFAFGKHLVFSRVSGLVYQLTGTAYDDNGAPLRRIRRCQLRPPDGQKVFVESIRPIVQTGVGLPVAQGAPGYDPQLIMRISFDGGKSGLGEGDIADQASIGKLGEYDLEVSFNRLGSGYAPVIEIEGSDPVPYRFTDCLVEMEVEA